MLARYGGYWESGAGLEFGEATRGVLDSDEIIAAGRARMRSVGSLALEGALLGAQAGAMASALRLSRGASRGSTVDLPSPDLPRWQQLHEERVAAWRNDLEEFRRDVEAYRADPVLGSQMLRDLESQLARQARQRPVPLGPLMAEMDEAVRSARAAGVPDEAIERALREFEHQVAADFGFAHPERLREKLEVLRASGPDGPIAVVSGPDELGEIQRAHHTQLSPENVLEIPVEAVMEFRTKARLEMRTPGSQTFTDVDRAVAELIDSRTNGELARWSDFDEDAGGFRPVFAEDDLPVLRDEGVRGRMNGPAHPVDFDPDATRRFPPPDLPPDPDETVRLPPPDLPPDGPAAEVITEAERRARDVQALEAAAQSGALAALATLGVRTEAMGPGGEGGPPANRGDRVPADVLRDAIEVPPTPGHAARVLAGPSTPPSFTWILVRHRSGTVFPIRLKASR